MVTYIIKRKEHTDCYMVNEWLWESTCRCVAHNMLNHLKKTDKKFNNYDVYAKVDEY